MAAVQLPEKTKFLFQPKRFKVLYGSRGSAKSMSVATVLILRAVNRPTRVLCARELQTSIRESVHRLLADTIERLELSAFFDITRDSIRGINGSEFIFEGLHNNVTKIKSMEGIDICWIEEAHNISEESLDILIPTIRKEGSEIWSVFNPYSELDAMYLKFVTPYLQEIGQQGFYEDDVVYVAKLNYDDNPWLPDELRQEMERTKLSDYKKYLHIWEGQPMGASDYAIIDPLWVKASIDAHIKLGWKARGIKALGLDLADEGKDNKGIIVRHGSVVTIAKSWTDGDLTSCIDTAFELAKEEGVTDLVYDQVGIGASVKVYLNTLQGRDKLVVTGFLGNDTPADPKDLYKNDRPNHDVFRNRRAQAFWLLRDRFEATYNAVENGVYTNPEELISLDSNLECLTELTSELSRIERKRGSRDLIQLESKADMRKRGMKSPGLADALSYAFSSPALDPDSWGQPIGYIDNGYA